mgnify:CR=1 FL=1
MRIRACLEWLEADHDIKILYAVESGSRAWDISSPDSDYDIRFIYVRPRDAYLGIRRPKDSIDATIGEYDFHGWDITKTCHLASKSNPSLLEWLVSDQRYIEVGTTADKLRRATREFSAAALMHHYTSLAKHTWRTYLEAPDKPLLKKYIYAVRPALCIYYMRQNEYKFPPLNFNSLIANATEKTLDTFTTDEVCWISVELEDLYWRKREASEADTYCRFPWLDELIGQVVENGHTWALEAPNNNPDHELLNVLCQDTTNAYACGHNRF